MGYARARPKHLARKLRQIRLDLKLSQREIAKRIGVSDYTLISKFELDKNEPCLAVLLAYSRAVQIPLERIIDDELTI